MGKSYIMGKAIMWNKPLL